MAAIKAHYLNYFLLQALDPNNSPGWDVQDQSMKTAAINNSKLPLFVKNVLVPQGPQETQVNNQVQLCYWTLTNDSLNYNLCTSNWLCSAVFGENNFLALTSDHCASSKPELNSFVKYSISASSTFACLWANEVVDEIFSQTWLMKYFLDVWLQNIFSDVDDEIF